MLWRINQFTARRTFVSSKVMPAMKPGTQIPGLDFMKNSDPAVSKERSEYPNWVNELEKPMVSLAKLKKMNFEEADLEEQKRYLKLSRRRTIKDNNSNAGL